MSDLQRESTGADAPPGQAPAVPASEMRAASGPSGPRSGFWRRAGAQILDSLILAVPTVIFFIALKPALAYVLYVIVVFGYATYFEGGPTGQTLGKRALGIRVIDFNTGGSIGYGRALLRAVVEIISATILYLGYLWMIWDREKQTWQDKAAGSVVVPVDAYPVQR